MERQKAEVFGRCGNGRMEEFDNLKIRQFDNGRIVEWKNGRMELTAYW